MTKKIHVNKVSQAQEEMDNGLKPGTAAQRKAIEDNDWQALLDALTDKQRNFVNAYIQHFNASQAVVEAGYQTKYPPRS